MIWEGAPRLGELERLASGLGEDRRAGRLTPEEELVGGVLSGLLREAHPIVVPASQVGAVPDELFEGIGEALRYASETKLPFPAVVFDFSEPGGGSVPLPVPEAYLSPDAEVPRIELRATLAGEDPERGETVWVPVIGAEGEPPELLGMVIVKPGGEPTSGVWHETVETVRGEAGVVAFSPRALAELTGAPDAEADAAPASVIPAPRLEQMSDADEWRSDAYLNFLASSTAAAVAASLKALFLLDSVNVELAELPVSRQVRRAATRRGARIASVMTVRQSRGAATTPSAGSREYTHRFEVRGNFAHYGPATQLYERSSPEQIKPCPRCGTCRRVWRPPHVKGPADKPLVPKTRRLPPRDSS